MKMDLPERGGVFTISARFRIYRFALGAFSERETMNHFAGAKRN